MSEFKAIFDEFIDGKKPVKKDETVIEKKPADTKEPVADKLKGFFDDDLKPDETTAELKCVICGNTPTDDASIKLRDTDQILCDYCHHTQKQEVEPVPDEKVISGCKTEEHCNTNECIDCGEMKDNISSGSAACYECDAKSQPVTPRETPNETNVTVDVNGDRDLFTQSTDEEEMTKGFASDYKAPLPRDKKSSYVKILTFHGRKGKGKTAAAMSVLYAIKGKSKKALVIELDKKATPIKENLFGDDPRILIENASKYMVFRPEEAYLKACNKTIHYVNFLLQKYLKRKDIGLVIIDGLEVFLRSSEGDMRHVAGIPLTGGIAWEHWNRRLLNIENLLEQAAAIASNYVVFTTKTRTKTIKDDDGKESEIEIIKWHNVIEDETDNVFKCTTIRDSEGNLRFMISAETCKVEIRSGAYMDVTGKKAYPLLIKEAKLEKSELK